MQLAKNLHCKGIWLNIDASLGATEIDDTIAELKQDVIVLDSPHWADIYQFLKMPARTISHQRNTNETKISIEMNMDGPCAAEIKRTYFLTTLQQLAAQWHD